jgi:hypothetical protein
MATRGKRNRTDEPTSKDLESPAKLGKAVEEVKATLPAVPAYPLNPDFLRLLTNMKAEQLKIPDGVIFICTREDKVMDVWKVSN